jgi:putative ABC transport system permease protein
LFYVTHLLRMSVANKVRLTLVGIGVFVAVFLFSAGLTIVNSYYAESIRSVQEMSENTAVVSSGLDPVQAKDMLSSLGVGSYSDTLLITQRQALYSREMDDGRWLTLNALVFGSSGFSKAMPVLTDDGSVVPVDVELVKGRLISQADLQSGAKVAVIDELTAAMLFPDGESIGKAIEVGVNVHGNVFMPGQEEIVVPRLEVIGVVKDSYVSRAHRQELLRELGSGNADVFVSTSVYVPLATVEELFSDAMFPERYLICSFEDPAAYARSVAQMLAYEDIGSRRGAHITVSTKERLLAALEQNLASTKAALNIIILVLCVISGISIMSITFFSVKERIPEIGIRKAFGASKADIAFQFMFEMLFIALLASVAAVAASLLACRLAEGYLTEQLFFSFSVVLSPGQLLLPLLVGMLEAALCSILPSLYAANIKVTDSLRFE